MTTSKDKIAQFSKNACFAYLSTIYLLCFRYPGLKRPLKFLPFKESAAVIVDSEKGNLIDLR